MFGVLKKLFAPRKYQRDWRRPVDGRVGIEVGFKGSASGRMKNLSATGVYFETDERCVVGSRIYFTIDLADSSGPSTLRCTGTVVRREERPNGRVGLGIKFDSVRES